MRLIDADELKENFECGCSKCSGLDDLMHEVDIAPTIDAKPIQTAHWIIGVTLNHPWMKCSECLVSQTLTSVFSYCPNCGADMVEDVQYETD